MAHITDKRTAIILEALKNKHGADWCTHYGESGYTDPEKGVILCNWNNVSQQVCAYLEEAGYALEWYDEWMIDYRYSKAYRTSPDSYSWACQVAVTEDGEWLTPDDGADAWIDEMSVTNASQSLRALPDWISADDIIANGFEQFETPDAQYETGFHVGQTDNPEVIAKRAFDAGAIRVVFRIKESSQFYTVWQAFAEF